jgi:hypothetical protein
MSLSSSSSSSSPAAGPEKQHTCLSSCCTCTRAYGYVQPLCQSLCQAHRHRFR